jgi:hypothetical protein
MHAKRILWLFAVALVIPFLGSSQRCAEIQWSKHRLKWRFFRAAPDKASRASALTASNIEHKLSVSGNTAIFHFSSSFSPCLSWVKVKDATLLMHEQTHFDLTEYYKRLLVKEILDQKFSARDIAARVREIDDRVNRLRIQANEQYDRETNHSINWEKQKEWTKKVRKMIRKLRRYKKPDQTISLTGR